MGVPPPALLLRLASWVSGEVAHTTNSQAAPRSLGIVFALMPTPVPPVHVGRARRGPWAAARSRPCPAAPARCWPRTRASSGTSPAGPSGTRRPRRPSPTSSRPGRRCRAAGCRTPRPRSRRRSRAGTGRGSRAPRRPDLLAVVEVVAAVGPQHVAEVVHQGVVLPGLVAGAVRDVRRRVLVEPLGDPEVLLPGPVAARGWGRSRGRSAMRSWYLSNRSRRYCQIIVGASYGRA